MLGLRLQAPDELSKNQIRTANTPMPMRKMYFGQTPDLRSPPLTSKLTFTLSVLVHCLNRARSLLFSPRASSAPCSKQVLACPSQFIAFVAKFTCHWLEGGVCPDCFVGGFARHVIILSRLISPGPRHWGCPAGQSSSPAHLS